jgi:hypothetical protein
MLVTGVGVAVEEADDELVDDDVPALGRRISPQ